MGRGCPFGVIGSFTSRWPHNILNVLNAAETYTKMINIFVIFCYIYFTSIKKIIDYMPQKSF